MEMHVCWEKKNVAIHSTSHTVHKRIHPLSHADHMGSHGGPVQRSFSLRLPSRSDPQAKIKITESYWT